MQISNRTVSQLSNWIKCFGVRGLTLDPKKVYSASQILLYGLENISTPMTAAYFCVRKSLYLDRQL